jgi:hypothetical protein
MTHRRFEAERSHPDRHALHPQAAGPGRDGMASMVADIRDIVFVNASDVYALNFIRPPGAFILRRHYLQGLRSHIMEVLAARDVALEKTGVVSEGIKWFPRARPKWMLRIFRTKFRGRSDAFEELGRVEVIGRYLGPLLHARSNEFLVSYRYDGKSDILLCGLQEYVEGLPIEPWKGFLNAERLVDNLVRPGVGGKSPSGLDRDTLKRIIEGNADTFCRAVKRMIDETGLIPDLAGEGNLILTDQGDIKLVDINNISMIRWDHRIALDDKGYPVCDKSVEALSELERHLAGRSPAASDALYRTFLDPGRMADVAALEKEFHQRHRRHSDE